MQAIIFALISYLGWGIGDVFGTIATRKIGGYQVAFWFFLLLIPIYSIFVLFFPEGIKNITLSILALNIILGIMAAISMITFYESLRLGSASLVGTISGAFPALVVPLSIIFLGEIVSLAQLMAIAVIMSGVIISTVNLDELKSKKIKLGQGVVLAIITMVLWGIYWTFIKIPVQQIGWAWPNLIAVLALPAIPILMKVRGIGLNLKSFQEARLPLSLNASIIGLATLSFNFAISVGGDVAIITPIAGSYPTLYALLAYFVFKDPLKINEIAGIVLTLTGIVLLSVLSV